MKKIPKLFFMKKMTVAATIGALIILLSLNVSAVPIEKAVAKKAEVAKAVPWSCDFNKIIPAPVISPQVQNVVNNTTGGDPIKKAKIQAWQKANGLHPDGVYGALCKKKAAANKAQKDQGAITDTSPANTAEVSVATKDKWQNIIDNNSSGNKANDVTNTDGTAWIQETDDVGWHK